MPVALRIVNDVSYVSRNNTVIPVFGEVAG